MPPYDNVVFGEKTAVIFDIGSAYVKCGFAGEPGPRFIASSELQCADSDLRSALKELLHCLYYRHLIVNPKDRRVVIVESVLTTSKFRSAVGDVLFNHFEVPSILFAPAHLLSLFTLGISTALVLDCGYSEAVVLPVFEGFTLLGAWQANQIGGKFVHSNLTSLLNANAFFLEDDSMKCMLSECEGVMLSESIVEDIKVRACFITQLERAKQWDKWSYATNNGVIESTEVSPPTTKEDTFDYPLTADSGGRSLKIPSRLRELAAEPLFSGDNDNSVLHTLLLDALLASPIDCRKPLIENIVCIGGTCMLPGFKQRLNEEIRAALELPRYNSLRALKDSIKFHNPPSKASFTAWLGGAIFGALECLPGRSFSRTDYQTTGSLPDWTTMFDAEAVDITEAQDVLHTR